MSFGSVGALFAQTPDASTLEMLACAAAWHGAAGDFVARHRSAHAVATTEISEGLAGALRE